MLLSKICEEFKELQKMVESEELFKLSYKIYNEKERSDTLLSWGADMRKLSRIEIVLENKKFESKAVKVYVDTYIESIRDIFVNYDKLVESILLKKDKENESSLIYKEETDVLITAMSTSIESLNKLILDIDMATTLVATIRDETWEPLPDERREDSVDNIIVSSETRSMSLNDVSTDVNNLDQFFNNICILVDKDKSKGNNIYLRKVETGSLTVAISCAMTIAPIIGFMFWCIKLCQDTAERSLSIEEKRLNNEEKRLKIINDKMSMAKEILEIKPDNKEADEIIQRCAIHIWEFLENNPRGTINGEYYDIGMEKPKIEDKEKTK